MSDTKIFKNQSKLQIKAYTDIDLTGATAYFVYKKPNGTIGTWGGTIETPATNGTIYYDIESGSDLDVSGNWKFYAMIVDSANKIGFGEPFQEYIYEPGEPPN